MQANAYVEAFQSRGVILWREGEALRYKAPPGVLTAEVLEKLRRVKDKILPVLPERAPSTSVDCTSSPSSRSVPTHAESEPMPTEYVPRNLRDYADPRRFAWEKRFEAIATGTLVAHWPTHAPDGTPYEPVRIAQGTTTDCPERWFSLAFDRYCRLWRLVHDDELRKGHPARWDCASRDLEILFSDLAAVFEQAESPPASG